MAELMCVSEPMCVEDDTTDSVQEKNNQEGTDCIYVHCACDVPRYNCYFCET